jgi:predicted porin
MKKLLIATAALAMVAGTAQAQSSVQVYGILDLGYSDQKHSADASFEGFGANASESFKQVNGKSGLSGSRLGFKGTEDLGGGLKANFVAEFQFSPTEANNGLASGTRLGFVELQSASMGSIRAGRQVSPTKAVNDAYTTFANSSWNIGSVTGGTDSADATNSYHTGNAGDRVGNAITYLTPVMSGFQAQIQVAKDTTKTDGAETTRAASAAGDALIGAELTAQTNQMNFGVSYTAGALSLMYARADQDAITAGAKTNTEHDAIGASYKLGAATLFATYNDKTVEAAGVKTGERKDTTVGINYNMGKWDLKAAYGDGKVNFFDGGAPDGTVDIKGYQVAAIYNLSKRTNVYVGYGDSESKAADSADKATRDGYIAGVRHSF